MKTMSLHCPALVINLLQSSGFFTYHQV